MNEKIRKTKYIEEEEEKEEGINEEVNDLMVA